MISVISVENLTTSICRNSHSYLGSRIGDRYDGVDACWCNPSDYMTVGHVEINVTWS